MYKKKFFFIVFDGVEGTGKSFQINRLYKSLKKRKLSVIRTREPGGSHTAEKIRNLIFNKKSEKFHKLTDFYLMLASRNEHIQNTINKARINRSIVLCDRFVDSTVAYQVVGNKISANLNKINMKHIVGKYKPNLTFILKSNIRSITSRINKRKNKNKFDKLSTKFYVHAQNTFLKIAKSKKNYKVFDSSLNNSQLEKKILSIVLKKISY